MKGRDRTALPIEPPETPSTWPGSTLERGDVDASRDEMPESFRSALQRGARIRRAYLKARFRRQTAGSFGGALRQWLAEATPETQIVLPENIDAERLRSGALRAAELGAAALLQIGGFAQFTGLQPIEFVSLVAQDLELDLKERIEGKTFRNREELADWVRHSHSLLRALQQLLPGPVSTTKRPLEEQTLAQAKEGRDQARVLASQKLYEKMMSIAAQRFHRTTDPEELAAWAKASPELPERLREALLLRLLGLSYQEIAETIGAPTEKTARLFVNRALERSKEDNDDSA